MGARDWQMAWGGTSTRRQESPLAASATPARFVLCGMMVAMGAQMRREDDGVAVHLQWRCLAKQLGLRRRRGYALDLHLALKAEITQIWPAGLTRRDNVRGHVGKVPWGG